MAPEVWMLSWRRIDEGRGHSMARVERLEAGWLCYGAEVLASPRETIPCNFTIWPDHHWGTREAEVNSVSVAGQRRLVLRVDEAREWWRDDYPLPDLNG